MFLFFMHSSPPPIQSEHVELCVWVVYTTHESKNECGRPGCEKKEHMSHNMSKSTLTAPSPLKICRIPSFCPHPKRLTYLSRLLTQILPKTTE